MKKVFQALGALVTGFVFLNIIFIIDYLYQISVMRMINIITRVNLIKENSPPPLFLHISFLILVGIASFYIFKSRLSAFWKAAYMNVPLAVSYVTTGILLFETPAVAILIAAIIFIITFGLLKKYRSPWLFYFVLIVLSLVMFVGSLLGVQI